MRYIDAIHYSDFPSDRRTLYLVQEYIDGESIRSLRNRGKMPNIASIAKEILLAISYLRDMHIPITHGYLNEKSIFLDKSGKCRVADFDLIPYLMYLKGTHEIHQRSDLDTLGLMLQTQSQQVVQTMNNFINQCCSGRVFSYSKLMKHPFLSNEWCQTSAILHEQKQSLLEHFDIEKQLGSGGFGDVLQAKHRTDKRSYAIKFIEMPNKSKKELEQMEREVEIISGITHKHVVRYITSWKQKINRSELRKYIDDDDESDQGSMSASLSKSESV